MDSYIHTLIAGASLMVAYYAGRYLGVVQGKVMGIATCVFVMSRRLSDDQVHQFVKDLNALEE